MVCSSRNEEQEINETVETISEEVKEGQKQSQVSDKL